MSFSDDPTSPTKKKRVRSNHEPRESPHFVSITETEKEIMNQQLLEMSRFSVSSINRDEEAFKSRHGSSLENPNHFETEKRIMSQEPHETSRFFVSPINRDKEAFKSRHGSFSRNPNYFETEKQIMSQEPHETSRFSVSPMNRDEEAFKNQHGSFSETTNYSERSLNSTGNNNDQSYLGLEASNNSLGHRIGTQLQMSNTSVIALDSGQRYGTDSPDSFADRSNFFRGSGRNRASMSSQRDDFRPEKQHTMSNVSNSSITDGVGMYTRQLEEAYDNYNLQHLGISGEGYGTPNLDFLKDQSNLFLGSGGNMASISSQSNMNQNAKVSNIGPQMQQKIFTSSISGSVGMNAKSVDSFTNINPQHGHDNYQRSGERSGRNNFDIFGPFGSIESMMKAQTEKQEIKMMPTPKLWSIKKILTQSDVNPNSGCLHLLRDSVDRHIRIHIPEADFQKVVNISGLNVNVFDYDTSTLHELRLGLGHRIYYVLKGNWSEDFLRRRKLRRGDEIGLFWDSYASRLQFSVLSGAKTKAPAVNKKP